MAFQILSLQSKISSYERTTVINSPTKATHESEWNANNNNSKMKQDQQFWQEKYELHLKLTPNLNLKIYNNIKSAVLVTTLNATRY
jgi:hypothetical protein